MKESTPDIYHFMKNSELFAELNPESTDRIANRLKKTRFTADEIICREGDAGNSMFIIVDGEVSILKDLGWGQRELQRMSTGEAFGEMALISTEPRTATVKTLIATECLQLDQRDFDELLDQDSHFAQRVAKILTKRLSDLGTESSRDLLSSYRALIFALAGLAGSRDPDTGAHLERTRSYCTLLADLMSKHSDYRDTISPAFVDGIHYVSPLHDIGKVAIPDNILLKPGRLTEEEFEFMKTHTTAGAMALKRVLEQSNQEIFQLAYRICLHHHERWDGNGYPLGFNGEDIPIEARIMSIADVFDALLSKRVYKAAMSLEETRNEMSKSSGTQFDPTLIETFINNIDRFEAIYHQYSDE